MILVTHESVNGGKNNLAVAHCTKTGEAASSFKGREAAERNLKRLLARRARKEAGE